MTDDFHYPRRKASDRRAERRTTRVSAHNWRQLDAVDAQEDLLDATEYDGIYDD